MKIVYLKTHALHAPQTEMDGERSAFYPHHEIPQRAERILEVLRADDIGEVIPAWIARTGQTEPIIPDLFALRRLSGRPEDPARQVGYYCFDSQTPFMERTWEAALSSAWCALSAADLLLEGEDPVYALCRPQTPA